jgi:hypothetical protein
MNQDNVGTLEACQRLAKAGIVLETEVFWTIISGRSADDNLTWGLSYGRIKITDVPAVQFTEVWRELPEKIEWEEADLQCGKTVQGENYAGYVRREEDSFEEEIYIIKNANPTDVVIDLLIWVTEQNEYQRFQAESKLAKDGQGKDY